RLFYVSSRRRHTRFSRDWSSACALPIFLIADAPTFEILKSRGMLESYRSPHADDIDPAYYDPDFTYYGTKIMATVIAYNTLLARSEERRVGKECGGRTSAYHQGNIERAL